MQEDKTFKISKNYERRLNLGGLTSRYDCISLGTFIQQTVTCKNMDELMNSMDSIANVTMTSTESDIVKALKRLIEIKEDGRNDLLIGTGSSFEINDLNTLKKISKKKEKDDVNELLGIESPDAFLEELSEVDIDKELPDGF